MNIKDYDFNNKKVLLRCDLNVTIKDGKIMSDERIIASLKTITYLMNQNAKIIVMSHLGKVKTKEDLQSKSLYPVYERLKELISGNIYFSKKIEGKELEESINKLKAKEILLIENTRFADFPDKKESSCDLKLAQYWASLADVFIDDAFGLSHRRHASNYGVTKFLPHTYGFLFQKELEGLRIITAAAKPLTIVMGGAKVEDKLEILKNILPKCDYLLVGGGIANSFIGVKHEIGKSLSNPEKYPELNKLLSLYIDKIVLPTDVMVLNQDNITNKNIDELDKEDTIYDIGKDTIELYNDYIQKSKTILLNGTMGMYENSRFENGTKSILLAISQSSAKSVIAGGDAISSSEHFEIKDFDFISTGGGATLEYIASSKLKAQD